MIGVVYITAHQEAFEAQVIEHLRVMAGNRPLVSISQRPLDLGVNVCVGDVGVSYRNMYLQARLGALTIDTEYVAICESDQLYPPGYLDFDPTGFDVWGYRSVWILRHWDQARFWRKEYGDFIKVVKRKYLIRRIEMALDAPDDPFTDEWGTGRPWSSPWRKRRWQWWDGDPVISFKTEANLSRTTGLVEGEEPREELPHWGRAMELAWTMGMHERVHGYP